MADDRERDSIENRIKGAGKQAEGKIRNSVGGLTGDSKEQLKGKAQELRGKAQSKFGQIQHDVNRDRNVDRDLDRNRDRNGVNDRDLDRDR